MNQIEIIGDLVEVYGAINDGEGHDFTLVGIESRKTIYEVAVKDFKKELYKIGERVKAVSSVLSYRDKNDKLTTYASCDKLEKVPENTYHSSTANIAGNIIKFKRYSQTIGTGTMVLKEEGMTRSYVVHFASRKPNLTNLLEECYGFNDKVKATGYFVKRGLTYEVIIVDAVKEEVKVG